MISEFKNIVQSMKHSASNDTFPLYASYLQSKDGYLKTCNDDSFSKFKFDAPFEGSVNIFVLESMLKDLDDNTTLSVEGSQLVIKCGNFRSKLPLVNIEVPERPLPADTQNIEVTRDLYDALTMAVKFTLSQSASVADAYLYKYIIIDPEAIISTDTSRSYFKSVSLDITKPVIINAKILNSLSEKSMFIGSFNNITFVEYSDGYSLFTTHMLDDYPISRIKVYYKNWNEGLTPLCSYEALSDAMKQVAPILMNEKLNSITLHNENSELYVSSESKINGTAEVKIPTEFGKDFKLQMDLKQFKGVAGDFTVYVKAEEDVRLLFLKSDVGSQVVLSGYPL